MKYKRTLLGGVEFETEAQPLWHYEKTPQEVEEAVIMEAVVRPLRQEYEQSRDATNEYDRGYAEAMRIALFRLAAAGYGSEPQ